MTLYLYRIWCQERCLLFYLVLQNFHQPEKNKHSNWIDREKLNENIFNEIIQLQRFFYAQSSCPFTSIPDQFDWYKKLSFETSFQSGIMKSGSLKKWTRRVKVQKPQQCSGCFFRENLKSIRDPKYPSVLGKRFSITDTNESKIFIELICFRKTQTVPKKTVRGNLLSHIISTIK